MSSLFNGPVPKVPEVRDGTSIEQLEDAAGVKNPPFEELLAQATKSEKSEKGWVVVVAGVTLCALIAAYFWAKNNGLF